MMVAAAEVVIGPGHTMMVYRNQETTDIDILNKMKMVSNKYGNTLLLILLFPLLGLLSMVY